MDVVKLDFPDRDLFILKDGDWRGYRSTPCAKEPDTVEWIRSFDEGSVLWDVGASVGPYSLIAAALGHNISAFEPFPPSYGQLQQNIWLNRFGSILAWPIALTHRRGHEVMKCSSMDAGSASHGQGRYETHVDVWPADDMADATSAPNHVKIDVDGAELGVIEGGRTLWQQVDSILVESQPPTIDDITVILQGAGLEMVSSEKRMGDTPQHNYVFKRNE